MYWQKGKIRRQTLFKLILVSLGLLHLHGCATPNISQFAEQTAHLTVAVESERKATVEKFNEIILGMGIAVDVQPLTGGAMDWANEKEKWIARKKSYLKSMNAVLHVLREVVAYSEALVDLAEAGEKGRDAVESLFNTVNGFATVTGKATFANTDSIIGKVLAEIGTAWTRIETQRSLRDAVLQVSGPNGAAHHVEVGIDQIFASVNDDLITALDIVDDQLALVAAGPARMGFYKHLTAPDRLERYFENARKSLPEATSNAGVCINPLTGQHDPDCIAGEEIQSMAALFAVLAVLEPNYRSYQARVLELSGWANTRRAKARAIVSAVTVWGQEHRKLAKVLDQCSGFRALRRSCGNLTAANLMVAVQTIEYVISDDGEDTNGTN